LEERSARGEFSAGGAAELSSARTKHRDAHPGAFGSQGEIGLVDGGGPEGVGAL